MARIIIIINYKKIEACDRRSEFLLERDEEGEKDCCAIDINFRKWRDAKSRVDWTSITCCTEQEEEEEEAPFLPSSGKHS